MSDRKNFTNAGAICKKRIFLKEKQGNKRSKRFGYRIILSAERLTPHLKFKPPAFLINFKEMSIECFILHRA